MSGLNALRGGFKRGQIKRKCMKSLFAGAALIALAQPASALAQQVDDDVPVEEMAQPAADLPEEVQTSEEGNAIVVTATKREQTLQDVPVAVSVTTAETIEHAEIRDLKDLQSLVPALRVTQLQSSANTSFIIRGFGAGNFEGADNPGIEPSVGVFIDGVYRSRTAAQIGDLPDVQRIEVLRGPQSTLFGKNASAGVISIVTREPKFKFGGAAEVSYGNYNAIVAKGYVTGGITDTIAASLAAGINKRDGFVQDLGYNGEANTRDRWFVRGQILFEPSSEFRLRLIGDYNRIDETCCAVVNLRRSAATGAINLLGGRVNDAATPFADVVWSNFPSSDEIENYGVSGQFDYQFGPFTITAITAYRESHALTNQDSDFTSADLIGSNQGDVDIETFTQELRLTGSLMDRFNLMLGAYYFDENVRYRNSLTFGNQLRAYADLLSAGNIALFERFGAGAPVGTFFRPGQGIFDDFTLDNKAYSLFGNVDAEIVSGVTLTLGANYTHDSKDASSNVVSTDTFSAITLSGPFVGLRPLQFLPQFRNFPTAVESGRTRDKDWSWTARLAFDVTDSVNA